MAKKTIDLTFLDSIGTSKTNYIEPKMTKTTATVLRLGILFSKHMADEMNKANSSSSGQGADSINPSEVEEKDGVYTVTINGKLYIKFVDQGVNGWARNRNSPYQFVTKGVDINGDMFKSVKAWAKREKSFTADTYKAQVPINEKERKRNRLSAEDSKVRSIAYMIKREGIKGTHFKDKALVLVQKDIKKLLGEAFKEDIIANIN